MSKKLKSGIIWSVIEVIIKRVSDFIVKLILARILFPEDFGVIGMATVFISFIQVLNDGGMGMAIVQKKDITDEHLNTVFWTNVVWSVLLYFILAFIAAPFAADYYNQPLLRKVIPVLSLSILTRALNTVHMAQLKRDMSFKKIAFANNFSSLIAGAIAVLFAFLGFGIWALVANELIAYLITVPMFYRATKWLPKLNWSKIAFFEILSFGLYTTGTRLLTTFASNADYLLIGKWVGSQAVGVYTLAFMMTSLVSSQVTMMLDRVMYPFYSKIQDDIVKIKSYYLKIIGYYALILYPIMTTLFLFAQDLLPLFFGNKWDMTIIPLKFLTLSIMIGVLTSGYNLLFRSIGKPKYEFKIQQITSILIYLPCLCVGIYYNGIIGAAIGVLSSSIIVFIINQFILKKFFDITFKQVLKETYKIISLCLVCSLLVFTLRFFDLNFYVILSLYIIVFTFFYFIFFKNKFLSLLKNK